MKRIIDTGLLLGLLIVLSGPGCQTGIPPGISEANEDQVASIAESLSNSLTAIHEPSSEYIAVLRCTNAAAEAYYSPNLSDDITKDGRIVSAIQGANRYGRLYYNMVDPPFLVIATREYGLDGVGTEAERFLGVILFGIHNRGEILKIVQSSVSSP